MNRSKSLSVCLMVKDEEILLPRCLDSVAGVADEIVLVDTGSTDRTLEIAREYGAKIAFWPWVRLDFSTPQNVAIDTATGDWILALDADNRLDPASHAEVRSRIETDELVGFLLRHFSYHDDEVGTSATEHVTLRLFPRHPAIRWVGRIHPQVLPVRPDLPFRVELCDAIIHHDGYRPNHYRRRQNLDGYRATLEELLRDNPDEPFSLFNLGALLLRLGHAAEADGHLARAIELNSSRLADGTHAPYVVHAHLLRVIALTGLDRLDDAWEWCARLIQLAPELTDAHCSLGTIEARRGHLADAAAAYERALGCRETPAFVPTDRATGGWKALLGLGQVYLSMGRAAAARRALERAAALRPTDQTVDALLRRASAATASQV